MTRIDLQFQGICTHLLPANPFDAPPFKLWTSDLLRVQHRVVLANSDLIPTHMPGERQPVAHVPKLLVPRAQLNEDLAELFDPEAGGMAAWRPRDVAIGFEGIDETAGHPSHYDSLSALPHIWMRAPSTLRQRIERGWSRFATAYVDFTAGVEFRTEQVDTKVETSGTLHFDEAPVMVVRHRNAGNGVRYSLEGVTELTISNEPENAVCQESDYLLHYFATTRDLLSCAPTWDFPPGENRSEVYCSSSQYP